MSQIDYEEISISEHEWLKYLISRQYQPDIARFIINNSPMRNQVQYMGAYYISLEPNFAHKFTGSREKDINLDIIYLDNRKRGKPTKGFGINQSKFSSLVQFAKIRKPSRNKIGAYFFGELHDEKGFVHWNIAFLSPYEEQMIFFDPNSSKKYTGEYDFHSRETIVAAFSVAYKTDIRLNMFLGDIPPQFICQSGRIGVDRFCQTWVLLFLDIFCNNLVEEFLTIDFKKYQTLVVKTWIICILDRMGGEESIIWTDEDLRYFPYCAIIQNRGEYVIESALECVRDVRVDNCAQMIIARFL